uniref:hypothetical protein n=1 Tax=uncultured Draconibacterium sp. TaxID=1573823 RepID=UPI0032169762
MIGIISFTIVVGLIILAYFLARKSALVCPNCKCKEYEKTGNKRELERNKRPLIAGPVPEYELEYKCKKCKQTYWSAIEKVHL